MGDLMGGTSRSVVRLSTAAIAVVLALAACGDPDGGDEPGGGPAPGTPPATSPATAAAKAQPAATVPIKGGKTTGDLGIEIKGGKFLPLINRGATVPATHDESFTTAEDNQPTIKIEVYRGASDRAADNQRVGGYELTVPTLQPKNVPQLTVTFAIDASGAFRLTATDATTGAPVKVSTLT
jgi:hypothetical protein